MAIQNPQNSETFRFPRKNNELTEITEMLIKPGDSCHSGTIIIKKVIIMAI